MIIQEAIQLDVAGLEPRRPVAIEAPKRPGDQIEPLRAWRWPACPRMAAAWRKNLSTRIGLLLLVWIVLAPAVSRTNPVPLLTQDVLSSDGNLTPPARRAP